MHMERKTGTKNPALIYGASLWTASWSLTSLPALMWLCVNIRNISNSATVMIISLVLYCTAIFLSCLSKKKLRGPLRKKLGN